MSLQTENKKALIEALIALILDAQRSTPTEGKEEIFVGRKELNFYTFGRIYG